MTLEATTTFYLVPDLETPYREGALPGVNTEADDATAAAVGYYRLWEDVPPRPGDFYDFVRGENVQNDVDQRVERVDSWAEWTDPQRKRNWWQERILEQVPDTQVRETVRDPDQERDISRSWAAASDKEEELDATADEDLDDFDPTLNVAPPQDGKGYARFTVSIIQLDPWAGAPDNIYGLAAELDIQTGYEDQGAEARLHIISDPGNGAGSVLPFEQESPDSPVWRVESRDGYKWSDPELPATVQVKWGAGSSPVTTQITCNGLYDRQARIVRYAVAQGQP